MTMSKAVDALCLKVSVVAGTGNGSAITVTGIATEDTVVACLEIPVGTTNGVNNRTTLTMISAANTITVSTATNNDKLIVFYHDASA